MFSDADINYYYIIILVNIRFKIFCAPPQPPQMIFQLLASMFNRIEIQLCRNSIIYALEGPSPEQLGVVFERIPLPFHL